MITFDKLKIVTKIKDITEIDTTVFVTHKPRMGKSFTINISKNHHLA